MNAAAKRQPRYASAWLAAGSVDVKYVGCDVVGYSRGRSVEAMAAVVGILNGAVRGALQAAGIDADDPEQVILSPAGDGMILAVVGDCEPDVHLFVAIELLRLAAERTGMADVEREMRLRVAVNDGVDVAVIDVNGRPSVAGAGINETARLLSLSVPGGILAGEATHRRLHVRRRWLRSWRGPLAAGAKHGQRLGCWRFEPPDRPWISTTPAEWEGA